MPTGAQFGIGFIDPSNPDYDRGHCDADRTHLANFTVGAQTPAFGNAVLRTVASNWRVSGILNARSGSWLTVTSGRDNAFNGPVHHVTVCARTSSLRTRPACWQRQGSPDKP